MYKATRKTGFSTATAPGRPLAYFLNNICLPRVAYVTKGQTLDLEQQMLVAKTFSLTT